VILVFRSTVRGSRCDITIKKRRRGAKRQTFIEPIELAAKRLPFKSIPIVSLKKWFHGSAQEKEELAREVNKICSSVGFMYLSDHEISVSSIQDVFGAARSFFSLPLDRKEAIHFRQTGGHRGYIPLRAESTDPNAKGDMKEAFDCGQLFEVDVQKYPNAAARAMAPNLWPRDLPDFQPIVEEYLGLVIDLAREIFRIWAVGFGLPIDYFNDEIASPINQLRLLHYPITTGRIDPNYLGIGTHCDYEALTILAQDDVGGLQVRNHDGDWVEATPIEGTFVVNIGEMMARWTNDTFVATPHRVINKSGSARFSAPLFFGTNYDTVIECLTPCLGPDRQSVPRYEPVVAGEYLASRLKEIYGT
jgi:isopenicillin N synthase-like dioxygenase